MSAPILINMSLKLKGTYERPRHENDQEKAITVHGHGKLNKIKDQTVIIKTALAKYKNPRKI